MQVYVVAVGRVRDPGVGDACVSYATRLRRRQAIKVVEVREAGRRGPTPKDVVRLEAEALERAAPQAARRVAITRVGTAVTSRELAGRLEAWRLDGRDVAMFVGGAFGLAPSLVNTCEQTMSLSAMTLPHELARLVLLEQLYRADTILHGEPYHKGRD